MNQNRNLLVLSLSLVIPMAGSWWLGRRSVQLSQLQPAPHQAASGNVLSRGLVRGNEEGAKPLVIPPEVSQVRLEARVEVDYPRYEAVLQTAESKRIWSKGDLEAQAFPGGKRVLFYISSSLLPPGDYILSLRGLPTAGSPETVAEYSFRVETSQRDAGAPVSAWTKGSPFDCQRHYEFPKCFAIDVTYR